MIEAKTISDNLIHWKMHFVTSVSNTAHKGSIVIFGNVLVMLVSALKAEDVMKSPEEIFVVQ